eukprot:29420-Pelagococcus_subviridis.AAC.5
MRQVDELRRGQQRASALRQRAVKVRRADEVDVEHHLRGFAVHGDDVPSRPERRRAAVADHRDAVAQVEVAAGVQVQYLTRSHRLHQRERGDGLERDRRRSPARHLPRAGRGVQRPDRLLRGDFGELRDERLSRRGRRLEPRFKILKHPQPARLRDVLERVVEEEALESVVRVRHDRVEDPAVLRFVLLHELDRVLGVLPAVAFLLRARVVRHAQPFVPRLEVQPDVDAVETAAVLRGRDPQRPGELRQRARVQTELPRDRAGVLVPSPEDALKNAPPDPRARRGWLDRHLQPLRLVDRRDRRHRAKVRPAEVQRRVADAEPGDRSLRVLRGVARQRRALREPRRRRRVGEEDDVHGYPRVGLSEALLQRPVRVPHQPFARAAVQRHVHAADVEPSCREHLVRGALRLRVPLGRAVRRSNPTRARDLFSRVAHGDDHRLSQIRPSDVHPRV